MTITQASPDSPDAITLINELEEHLESFGYPPQSRHGFSVDKLIREGVPFFIMRQDNMPVGCGGIKLFGTDYGEIKRMFVRPVFQGKGFGKAMLQHLADYARQHGVNVLRLETGIHQVPAIRLYEAFGFRRCGPFGEYREDPVSVYMEMDLSSNDWLDLLTMELVVLVVSQLSPGLWRVIVGPGVGMLDGGSEQNWPDAWIPTTARRPNGEFRINGFSKGVPQVVTDSLLNSPNPSPQLRDGTHEHHHHSLPSLPWHQTG